jgi:hypothetical protein
MLSTWYFWLSGVEPALLEVKSNVDTQIDLWNRHLTNNDVWVFSYEIKELRCKLLFIIICKLCIFTVSSTLLVHMGALHEPFLHDAIEEIAHVRPQCSSVSRATLSWSFWHCGLNFPAVSLVMRYLTFSITLVNIRV